MTMTLPPSLATAGEVIRPQLETLVAGLEPSVGDVARYHLGWTDEHGLPATGGGGKALRPALTLLSAQAVGGGVERALPGAVAVELVHNFSLLHDDVMDGDLERRHRPTAWHLFGVPAAILTGDALLTLAVAVLGDSAEATARLSDTVQRLIAGQSRDVEFERRDQVGLAECLAMAAGKTGALMSCATALGPLLVGASPAEHDALSRFGDHLGLAFQLVDDLLGIWGSPEVTGKPVLSDLRVRKKSLPVVAALNSGTAAGRALHELYRRPDGASEDDLHRMAELVEQAGGLLWTEREAVCQVRRARACLAELDAAPEPREALWEIACFITERDR